MNTEPEIAFVPDAESRGRHNANLSDRFHEVALINFTLERTSDGRFQLQVQEFPVAVINEILETGDEQAAFSQAVEKIAEACREDRDGRHMREETLGATRLASRSAAKARFACSFVMDFH